MGASHRKSLLAIGMFIGCFALTPAQAQNYSGVPTDYLVQKVCVDGNNVAMAMDPVQCPNALRALYPGEALPYHKVDMARVQISDSFPIKDDRGISVAVQSYYYANYTTVGAFNPALDKTSPAGAFFNGAYPDPRFPNMVHFDAEHGGYNIIGADAYDVFFRGTYDAGGGWQPWWTANCEAKGWKLFPNSAAAFSYGGMNAPSEHHPDCPGQISTQAANAEWNSVEFTFASGKRLQAIYDFFYAPGYGAIEVNYFTQEYGVTRWEAWRIKDNGQVTDPYFKNQCPNSVYEISQHGRTYYMADCRDWSTIVYPPTRWNPYGTGVNVGTTSYALPLTWPVDPLYTGTNILKNTHIGGPYSNNGPRSCATVNWDRVNSPTVVNWTFDDRQNTPFTNTGNCTLRFSTPAAQNGQNIFQRQARPSLSGVYSYGGMFWAPFLADNETALVRVAVEQRDLYGRKVGTDASFTASLSKKPATFSADFKLEDRTSQLVYRIYPLTPNKEYEFTGAWIAKKVVLNTPSNPVNPSDNCGGATGIICP
jgi:hypothetical protein